MSENYHNAPSSQEPGGYSGVSRPLPYIESSPGVRSQPSSVPPSSQSDLPVPQRTRMDQLASTHQVGTVVSEYKPLAPILTIDGCASALGGAFLLALTLFVQQQGVRFLVIMPLAGIVLLIYGLPRSAKGIQATIYAGIKNTRLFYCTEGVMRVTWGRVKTMRWDRIIGVQKSLAPGQTSRFARTRGRSSISAPTAFSLLQLILYPEEGEPLKLDNGFIGFEGLAGEIERKVRRRLLPDAIAAYESGQSRNFGMLDVTPQGLSLEHDQKALPWERLGSVEVRGEDVIIRESGAKAEWARINVAEMLNICILLPLIDHVQRARIKKLNSEPKILGYRLPTGALSQQSEWQDYEQ